MFGPGRVEKDHGVCARSNGSPTRCKSGLNKKNTSRRRWDAGSQRIRNNHLQKQSGTSPYFCVRIVVIEPVLQGEPASNRYLDVIV